MLAKIRQLSRDLAIYGVGDVVVSVVNFLLLPLYVRYLNPAEYGVLGLLGSVEVIAKIFFRWGLDGSFMRLFYDCETTADRQRLASTLFFFLLALNGVLLAASLAVSPIVAEQLFGTASHLQALQLTLVNTFIIGFTFFPFHLLRMEQRSGEFVVLTLSRSVTTVVLRLVLIMGFGMGVMGVVLADLVVTVLLMAVLFRRFSALIRPTFSHAVLREGLRFGLPRVPHAAAQQVIAVGDKIILTLFVPLAQLGVYSMGVSFGLTQKLFLSAFEYAWAPFYYANAREPDAPRLFSRVATYGFAVLALLTAGLSAIGRDLLVTVVGPDYAGAAPIVAWTAVGVMFQGIYLLTSIGLNITRRTEYYPVSTLTAAVVNVGLNFLLIPVYGIVGAAWATAVSYAVQAALAFGFSQRFYPIRYDAPRLLTIGLAAIAAWGLAYLIPALPPAMGVVVRGSVVVLVFGSVLAAGGVVRLDELRRIAALGDRKAAPAGTPPETTELAGELVATDLADDELVTATRRQNT
ncbi:MAG TPA: polysaccharide biosynthesis C-terminal domain-containing protein [Vicinamibacterales bacterium]|nr:polysaccharide biosynthesis C-terminal domain-containing protein [Vicinamibacterales bacterium]